MMASFLAVAIGGALGAVARYFVSAAMTGGSGFPWATMAINLSGCLGIGLAWGSWSHLHWFQEWGRAFLLAGVLGGFTTFSAFSLETLLLIAADRLGMAATYAALSLIGCVLAAWLGYRWSGL